MILNKKCFVFVLFNDDYNSRIEDILVVVIILNLIVKDYIVMLINYDFVEGIFKMDFCVRVDKIYMLF